MKKSRRPLSIRACQSPHPRAPEPVEPAAPADTEPEEQVASIESNQYESAEDIGIGSAGRGIRKESLQKASILSLRVVGRFKVSPFLRYRADICLISGGFPLRSLAQRSRAHNPVTPFLRRIRPLLSPLCRPGADSSLFFVSPNVSGLSKCMSSTSLFTRGRTAIEREGWLRGPEEPGTPRNTPCGDGRPRSRSGGRSSESLLDWLFDGLVQVFGRDGVGCVALWLENRVLTRVASASSMLRQNFHTPSSSESDTS